MKAKQTGFTLIELMFTIVVLAVLLGIGVPNFRDFIRNSRMTAAANDLLADINLARSEAVKRRARVTLCKSDGTDCDTTASAFRRWIVFVDEGTPGEVDGSDAILRDSVISSAIPTAAAEGTVVVYLGSGFPDVEASDLSRVLFCDERGSAITAGGLTAARGVAISATGRAVVSRDKAKVEAATSSGGFGGCP